MYPVSSSAMGSAALRTVPTRVRCHSLHAMLNWKHQIQYLSISVYQEHGPGKTKNNETRKEKETDRVN